MSSLANLEAVVAALAARRLKVPPALARGLATAQNAPAAVQPRLAAAVAALFPALRPLAPYESALCPSYPEVRGRVAARLALGEAPAKVLRGLTPREAHEALTVGVEDPVAWILRGIPAHGVRTVAVARWVAACWRDPARRAALETDRREVVAGAEVRGRLIDRVDEIRVADLPRGEATGVRDAYESAARRAYASWEAGAATDETPLAPRPSWWRPIRCARILETPAQLVGEGCAMAHCVGTYAAHVRSTRSVIVAIAIRVGVVVYRSTAEIDRRTGAVIQHRGHSNREAPQLCVRALHTCLRRWGFSLEAR